MFEQIAEAARNLLNAPNMFAFQIGLGVGMFVGAIVSLLIYSGIIGFDEEDKFE